MVSPRAINAILYHSRLVFSKNYARVMALIVDSIFSACHASREDKIIPLAREIAARDSMANFSSRSTTPIRLQSECKNRVQKGPPADYVSQTSFQNTSQFINHESKSNETT